MKSINSVKGGAFSFLNPVILKYFVYSISTIETIDEFINTYSSKVCSALWQFFIDYYLYILESNKTISFKLLCNSSSNYNFWIVLPLAFFFPLITYLLINKRSLNIIYLFCVFNLILLYKIVNCLYVGGIRWGRIMALDKFNSSVPCFVLYLELGIIHTL